MSDILVLSGLQDAVAAAVARTTMPTIPIKYIGRSWSPPNDQRWIELVLIPNNAVGEFWGEEKNYRGMFRIIIHWPNDDQGAYAPIALLTTIGEYFTKYRFIDQVKITDNSGLMNILENGTETLYPMSIRYQCFRQAPLRLRGIAMSISNGTSDLSNGPMFAFQPGVNFYQIWESS